MLGMASSFANPARCPSTARIVHALLYVLARGGVKHFKCSRGPRRHGRGRVPSRFGSNRNWRRPADVPQMASGTSASCNARTTPKWYVPGHRHPTELTRWHRTPLWPRRRDCDRLWCARCRSRSTRASRRSRRPANRPELEKKTTPFMLRWRRVASTAYAPD